MPSVESAADDHCRGALEILLQDMEPSARETQIAETMTAASRGEVSLEGLLIAWHDGLPAGAILLAMQSDGCGFVWPPVVSSTVEPRLVEQIADLLLEEVCRRLDADDAWLGQSIIDPSDTQGGDRLQRHEFRFLADLDYLRRPLREGLPALVESVHLDVVRIDPDAEPDRLAAVIERTYVGSADCPEISGWRSGLEAVHGHRSTGVLLRDQWLIFQDSSGNDVGVLVLADQPEQDAWELVYMGVTPDARGLGYGREIVVVALKNAENSARSAVLLAVDAENRFARTIYETLGFRLLEVKRVFARRHSGNPPT
ncbi:MAG: GNAT family N-acetyltransferase [Planctomycetes bacterium]|nr:GNAT family N-acetyltransferase [Planctomycetota bacterium]